MLRPSVENQPNKPNSRNVRPEEFHKNEDWSLNVGLRELEAILMSYEKSLENNYITDSDIAEQQKLERLKELSRELRDYLWGDAKPGNRDEFIINSKQFLLRVMEEAKARGVEHNVATDLYEMVVDLESADE